MSKFLKYAIRDGLRYILGSDYYTKIRFLITHKYMANLENPKSFSEKIISRKFDGNSLSFSRFVDKFTVRSFVEETIGKEYLIPLYKVKDFIQEDDFNDLPSSFVIKTSNGGGGENVLIVEDKYNLNISDVCDRFNYYLSLRAGEAIDELFYDVEKPRIIIEKLIKSKDGLYPSDYKLHIFNSYPNDKVFIQVDSDRFTNHKRSIYNEDLTLAPFSIQPKYPSIEDDFIFPSNIDKLISLAKKLSKEFKYVRVDMYNVDGAIYFGEMTFCHGSGWEPISSKEFDFILGSYWDEYN